MKLNVGIVLKTRNGEPFEQYTSKTNELLIKHNLKLIEITNEQLVKESKQTGNIDVQTIRDKAKEFIVGNANVYGTVSFYDFLKQKNEGKKAYICNGSACLLAGTQEHVRQSLSKHLKSDEIGHMCCLGRCHENGGC